jgi:hypothetical protein
MYPIFSYGQHAGIVEKLHFFKPFTFLPLNSDFIVQTAILLDIVRDEVLRGSHQLDKGYADGFNRGWESPPWASHALDLVKLILRPPEGGPPCLPDQSEQVYFLLLIECA